MKSPSSSRKDQMLLNGNQIKNMHFTNRWSYLDFRLIIIILFSSLSLLIFFTLSTSINNPFSTTTITNYFSAFTPLKTLLSHHHHHLPPPRPPPPPASETPMVDESVVNQWKRQKKMNELTRSRIAVCLVGGARRFELTGPSIVENVLKIYPNSDLFLHSPFDRGSYKFSLLKDVPRLASVRIFKPQRMPETESQLRVLTSSNSPNGIQGLLQYFNLVEGCLTMIKAYQNQNSITYDWIVRTRVDGYWSAPLDPDNFDPDRYVVPRGSSYGGLNDRLGVGNLNTSIVALSRLSLIPELDAAEFRELNSETSFKAQLTTKGVDFVEKRHPFCVMSDRKYTFPPMRNGVPVAAMSSPGPLSGTKCRACKPVCGGPCVADVMGTLSMEWSWTDWENGTVELCDAHDEWESGWEEIFDRVAGSELAVQRKRIESLELRNCIDDFAEMKKRAVNWEAPDAEEMCRLGLAQK